jgi:hypothetical protein
MMMRREEEGREERGSAVSHRIPFSLLSLSLLYHHYFTTTTVYHGFYIMQPLDPGLSIDPILRNEHDADADADADDYEYEYHPTETEVRCWSTSTPQRLMI